MIKFIKHRSKRDGKPIELYPYQKAFLKALHENDNVVVCKARQLGYTTAYILHLVCSLYNAFKENNGFVENPKDAASLKYLIIAHNGMMSNEHRRMIEEVIDEIHEYDFTNFVNKYKPIIYSSCSNVRSKLISVPEVQEAFMDEFAFFYDWNANLQYILPERVHKIVGVTTFYFDREAEEKDIKNLMERTKKKTAYIETHWYEHPAHRKNLMWIVPQPTIDKEGNTEYNEEEFKKKIAMGWIPTSSYTDKMNNYRNNNEPNYELF